jgi:DNA-binding SARP family transcriptional activator
MLLNAMSQLDISLFGKFSVCCNGENLAGLDSLKVQELFSYLLLYRQQPHTREKLAGLLWPDSSTAQSKRYLRQTLWQLQTKISAGTLGAPEILLVESEWIQINKLADFRLDVALLEKAFTAVQGKHGADLDATGAACLEDAIHRYRGDLLDNWYQDWCIFERQRLQSTYLAILDKLMEYCECRQEYEMGTVYALNILKYDQAREQTHRHLMRLRYLAGDRTGALRQFQYCAEILHKELGVKPSQRTEQLCQQIAADQPLTNETTPVVAYRPLTTPLSTSLLPDILSQLQALRQTLHHAEEQLTQKIETVENWLDSQ